MVNPGKFFTVLIIASLLTLISFDTITASKKKKEGPRVLILVDEHFEGKKNKKFTDSENAIRNIMGKPSPCFVQWDLGHQIIGMNKKIERLIKKGKFNRKVKKLLKKNDIDFIITGTTEIRDQSRAIASFSRSMKSKLASVRLKVIDARKTSLFFLTSSSKAGAHIEHSMASRKAVEKTVAYLFFVKNAKKDQEPTEFYLKILSLFQSRYMLERNIDINKKNKYKETILHNTATVGNRSLAESLIAKGADIRAKDNAGRTPLHNAAKYGKLNTLKLLIEKGADINDATNNKTTALHFAASRANSKMLKFLIQKRALVDSKNNISRTPLHLASEDGIKTSVEILIRNKASVSSKDEKEKMPIHCAAENGHHEIVNILIENGSDAKAEDKNNMTPMHYAAGSGDLKTVSILMGKGVSVTDGDREGLTPLHHAAQTFNADIVSFLIKSGAKIDAPDKYGWTPLHFTALLGRNRIAEILIQQGATINVTSTEEVIRWHKKFPIGTTPLSIAKRKGDHMVKLFEKYDAK